MKYTVPKAESPKVFLKLFKYFSMLLIVTLVLTLICIFCSSIVLMEKTIRFKNFIIVVCFFVVFKLLTDFLFHVCRCFILINYAVLTKNWFLTLTIVYHF